MLPCTVLSASVVALQILYSAFTDKVERSCNFLAAG
jgi:hypothetical protein